MTISVITIRLHEEAHRLGDEYYKSLATWIREHRENPSGTLPQSNLEELKRTADAYLRALTVFREHLGTLRSNNGIARQVELTDTFIELINKNKGVYDRAVVDQKSEQDPRDVEAGKLTSKGRRITPGVSKARA